MRPIFKTEMFIYQSKANLDEKSLFGKISHQSDPEIRKMLVNGKFRNEDSTFQLWSMIYLLLKLNPIYESDNVSFIAS